MRQHQRGNQLKCTEISKTVNVGQGLQFSYAFIWLDTYLPNSLTCFISLTDLVNCDVRGRKLWNRRLLLTLPILRLRSRTKRRRRNSTPPLSAALTRLSAKAWTRMRPRNPPRQSDESAYGCYDGAATDWSLSTRTPPHSKATFLLFVLFEGHLSRVLFFFHASLFLFP
jgi:hypothetical protein